MEVQIDFEEKPYCLEYQKIKYKGPSYHRTTLELIFVMKGMLKVESNGEETLLKPGDFMLINASMTHTLNGDGDTFITSLYLDLNQYSKKYSHIHGYNFYCKYIGDEIDEDDLYFAIRNFFIRLMVIENMDMKKKENLMIDICDILMDILVNHVIDLEYMKNKVAQLKQVEQERLFSISKYISENWRNQGFSLADVAKHENLSTTRLSHVWKSITSISFMESINLYRYYEAKRLLISTDKSISEISESCGFSDEKYLYKLFKEKLNMTPKEYRDHYKNIIKKPNEYTLWNISEITEVLDEYIKNNFKILNDYSFLTRFPDKIKEEKKLNELYGVVASLGYKFGKKEKVDNDAVIIRLGHNQGISKDKDEVIKINWEYVYIVSLITIILFDNSRVSIEIDFLGVKGWLDIFDKIYKELSYNWGDYFEVSGHLVIRYYGWDNYHDAVILAEKMEKNDFFISAKPILFI